MNTSCGVVLALNPVSLSGGKYAWVSSPPFALDPPGNGYRRSADARSAPRRAAARRRRDGRRSRPARNRARWTPPISKRAGSQPAKKPGSFARRNVGGGRGGRRRVGERPGGHRTLAAGAVRTASGQRRAEFRQLDRVHPPSAVPQRTEVEPGADFLDGEVGQRAARVAGGAE